MVAIAMGKKHAVDGAYPKTAQTECDILHGGIQPRIDAVEPFVRQKKNTVRFSGVDKDKRDCMRTGRRGKSVLRHAFHRERCGIRAFILLAGGKQQYDKAQ